MERRLRVPISISGISVAVKAMGIWNEEEKRIQQNDVGNPVAVEIISKLNRSTGKTVLLSAEESVLLLGALHDYAVFHDDRPDLTIATGIAIQDALEEKIPDRYRSMNHMPNARAWKIAREAHLERYAN